MLLTQGERHDDERAQLNRMWAEFNAAGLSGPEFASGFLSHPLGRSWELLLGCILLEAGHDVSHQGRGPDFKLMHKGAATWIEATAPSAGESGSPNAVPRQPIGTGNHFPQDAVEQRVIGAIRVKLKQWDKSWLDLIGPQDVFVLALNTSDFGITVSGRDVANALFGAGMGAWRIHTDTDGKAALIDESYGPELAHRKANGAKISKNGFRDGSWPRISAILYGHCALHCSIDAALQAFTIYHNPTARNPLAPGALRIGREYRLEPDGDRFGLNEIRPA